MKRYSRRLNVIERHQKDVVARLWQRQVEHKDRRRLNIDHAGGRLVDFHESGLFQQHIPQGIHQAHGQLMAAELRAPTP